MYKDKRRQMNHFLLPYRAILFDLDGTIIDSAPGIYACIEYALQRLDAAVPPQETMRAWLGPPLQNTFAHYLGSEESAAQAIAFYRERYTTGGMFDLTVYAGIPALLADLQQAGAHLYLSTSKPQVYARQILQHLQLATSFTYIGGATLDGTISGKNEVIADVLTHIVPDTTAETVVIGDRAQDIWGAQHHNLPCIAVAYGYASPEELTTNQPALIVQTVAELRAALLGAAS